MSLGVGFEVSNTHAKTTVSVCLSLPISWPTACGSDVSSQLLLQHHAYLSVAMLPAKKVTDASSGTVKKPPMNCFLLLVALVIDLYTAIEN